MKIIDTQVLIHMAAGRRAVPNEGVISSINAKEFLFMYGEQNNRDRYYVSAQFGRHSLLSSQLHIGKIREHTTRRQGADRLVINFNNEYPSIVEFSNLAIAHSINKPRRDLFKNALGD